MRRVANAVPLARRAQPAVPVTDTVGDDIVPFLLRLIEETRAAVRQEAETLAERLNSPDGQSGAPRMTARDVRGALQSFESGMMRVLEPAYTQAAYLGRRLAGNDLPAGNEDEAFGRSITREQAAFLAGFVSDIEDGRYTTDGMTSEATIGARAELYADRLYGVGNEAWLRQLGPDVLIHWVDTGDKAECGDCAAIAEGGPYLRDDLPTVPGAGGTECGTRCRCVLVTEDGRRGFRDEE